MSEAAQEAAQQASHQEATQPETQSRRQVKVGTVVSDKMDKTVVVEVTNTIKDSLYQRYLKRRTKFHAHDASNECKEGDVVEIVSCRPLSRTKRWRVREILKRAE